MSYPEPIEGESPERLYRQAMFFYKEYERVKAELADEQQNGNVLREHFDHVPPCDDCIMVRNLYDLARRHTKTVD